VGAAGVRLQRRVQGPVRGMISAAAVEQGAAEAGREKAEDVVEEMALEVRPNHSRIYRRAIVVLQSPVRRWQPSARRGQYTAHDMSVCRTRTAAVRRVNRPADSRRTRTLQQHMESEKQREANQKREYRLLQANSRWRSAQAEPTQRPQCWSAQTKGTQLSTEKNK
jgi:hypothetical protein